MGLKNIFIKLGIIGGKKAKGELGGVDKALKGLAKSAVSAGAAFFATRGIIRGMSSSVQLAAKFEGVQRGFNNLAKSAGFSAEAFNKFRDATDGTMGSVELMTQANNAMLLGITDSEDQMAEMFDVAQRLAQALGKDAAFGVESLITGLGRQSKLMLDNLGIMIDTEKAYTDYAKSVGKTASALTDQEKKQAFVNTAMKEAQGLVKKLGDEQLTSLDKMKQFSTSIDDMKIALGGAISEAMGPFVDKVNEKLQELGDVGWDNIGKALANNLSTILDFAGESAAISARIAGLTIMSGLSQGLKDSLPAVSETFDAIGQFFGGLKGLITGVPPAVGSMGVAIKQSLRDAGFDETGFKISALKAELKALGIDGFDFVITKAKEIKEVTEAVEKAKLPEAPKTDAFDIWLNTQKEVIGQSEAAAKATEEAAKVKNAALEQETDFVDALTEMYPELANQINAAKEAQASAADTAGLDAFIFKQQKIVDTKAQESKWIDIIKEKYPELASSMNLMGDEQKAIQEIASANQEIFADNLEFQLMQIDLQAEKFRQMKLDEVAITQFAEEAKRDAVIANLEEQSVLYNSFMAGYDQFVDTMVDTEMRKEEKFKKIQEAAKNAFTKLLADQLKDYLTNLIAQQVIAKTGEAAAIASSVATGTAIASAYAVPASLAATASFGAAAVSGTAAITASVAATKAMAVALAEGGDFITKGPQLLMVGEAGKERVSVTPIENSNLERTESNSIINVNISGGVVQEDYVRNELIPALNKATGTGARLNA